MLLLPSLRDRDLGSARRGLWRGSLTTEPWPSLAPLSASLDLGGGASLFHYDSSKALPPGPRASSGPCLVLIHGLGDEADSFRQLLPLLAPSSRVLAPDLPGFGRSVPRGRVTLSSCARAVEALVAAETPSGAVLVGSSLGASLAQLVAMRARVPVLGLVLMDGGLPAAPGSGEGMAASVLPFLGEARYRSLRGRPEAAYESLGPYYADLGALDETDRAFLARRVVERVESEVQMRSYFSLLRSLVLRAGLSSRAFASFMARTGLPILILWGEDDRILPVASARLLGSLAKGATQLVLAGAGHLPHQERPQAAARAILDFLGPRNFARPD